MFDAILKHLNANSGAYTVVFTFFVTAATVMYAVLTRTLVVETRRMRESQTEPELSVAAVPTRTWLNWINMDISNIGAGAAHNIRLTVTPDFENRPGQYLSQLGPFKNGITHLPPGSKVVFFVTEMVGKDSEKRLKSQFTIQATFENEEGRTIRREFPISLSYMEGLMAIDKDPLIGLREHVEEIEKTFRQWATAARGEIEHRLWASENYFFKSPLGIFSIRPQAGMRHHYRLICNQSKLDVYVGVNDAVNAVHEHKTGHDQWDQRSELEAPANLAGWEMGVPEDERS